MIQKIIFFGALLCLFFIQAQCNKEDLTAEGWEQLRNDINKKMEPYYELVKKIINAAEKREKEIEQNCKSGTQTTCNNYWESEGDKLAEKSVNRFETLDKGIKEASAEVRKLNIPEPERSNLTKLRENLEAHITKGKEQANAFKKGPKNAAEFKKVTDIGFEAFKIVQQITNAINNLGKN